MRLTGARRLQHYHVRRYGSGVDLTLHPVAHETGGLDLGDKYSRLKKGYGVFQGEVTLGDGRTLALSGVRGFAEEMELSW